MSHRPPTGSAVVALVATLVAALASGGCAPGREDPAADNAGVTTSVSTSAARESTSAARQPTSAARESSPTTRTAPTPADSSTAAARPSPPPPFIESATWGDSDYGVTLKVAPSTSGRQAWGARDSRTAWQEVLRLVPEADTPGMWEQFDCHWTWARLLEPGKPTWNLEPWRPVVSPERMLAEGCNPGGPEV